MARRKVKLAYIANNSARRATCNKRQKSFVKKLNDLSTLCGVDTCAIIYNQSRDIPHAHPSPQEAERVLHRFSTVEDAFQVKKTFDMEMYLKQSIDRAGEQLKRLQIKNRNSEMAGIMFGAFSNPLVLKEMGVRQLNELKFVIEQYSLSVRKRLKNIAEIRAKEEEEERALAEVGRTMAMDDDEKLMEMINSFKEQLDPIRITVSGDREREFNI